MSHFKIEGVRSGTKRRSSSCRLRECGQTRIPCGYCGPEAATLVAMVDEGASVDVKRMRLRYAGTCSSCGAALGTGTTADYDRASKTVACVACPTRQIPSGQIDPPSPPAAPRLTTVEVAIGPAAPQSSPPTSPRLNVVDGQGGASAANEFKRRHRARQDRVITRHPRLGRFLLAVFDDPQSTRAWSVGAEGERKLSEMLATIAGDSLRVLHDRRIPGTKANIDHLVMSPKGVFVVDAKRYRDARPALRVEGGLLRPRTEFLTVGGRDRTALVTGIQKQIALVRKALAGLPEVSVKGVLCFVDADWPFIGAAFTVNDVAVMSPRKLKALLAEPGPLDEEQIADVQWRLHETFPRQKSALSAR